MNRKELIKHYSQTKCTNSNQKIGERSMVLINAEMTLHPDKWKNPATGHTSIATLVTYALEQVFGEEVE